MVKHAIAAKVGTLVPHLYASYMKCQGDRSEDGLNFSEFLELGELQHAQPKLEVASYQLDVSITGHFSLDIHLKLSD